jgi:hypothetical protein
MNLVGWKYFLWKIRNFVTGGSLVAGLNPDPELRRVGTGSTVEF